MGHECRIASPPNQPIAQEVQQPKISGQACTQALLKLLPYSSVPTACRPWTGHIAWARSVQSTCIAF